MESEEKDLKESLFMLGKIKIYNKYLPSSLSERMTQLATFALFRII